MFITKNEKLPRRREPVSMNNCYYRDFEWRENRETKPEVCSSKVDKRNGALCTQREHALASSKGERYKLSVGEGAGGRSVTKWLKSAKECCISSYRDAECHLVARFPASAASYADEISLIGIGDMIFCIQRLLKSDKDISYIYTE